jgi:hypothetical protein
MIIFTVFHDTLPRDKSLGRVAISVSTLLEYQHQKPEEGKCRFIGNDTYMIDTLKIRCRSPLD